MEGVVTVLDPVHYRAVQQTWGLLERELGLRGVLVTPYPHFSYHIAGKYDADAVGEALHAVATRTSVFRVRTRGISTFPEPDPVVFIAIEPNEALRRLHRDVLLAIEEFATEASPYYRPDVWVPHITLAHGDRPTARSLTRSEVQRAVRRLGKEKFEWDLPVDNLTLIRDRGGKQELGLPVPLGD
jgi:2'-5' RNA ligase